MWHHHADDSSRASARFVIHTALRYLKRLATSRGDFILDIGAASAALANAFLVGIVFKLWHFLSVCTTSAPLTILLAAPVVPPPPMRIPACSSLRRFSLPRRLREGKRRGRAMLCWPGPIQPCARPSRLVHGRASAVRECCASAACTSDLRSAHCLSSHDHAS